MQHFFYRFLRWCPGALGLLLRQKLYPRLLGQCGHGVLFGRFVDVIQPQRISLGDRVIISNYVSLDASGCEGGDFALSLEHDVFIGRGTDLLARKNGIVVQSGANVGSSCNIVAGLPVRIGQNVLLAAYCTIGARSPNISEFNPKKEPQTTPEAATVVEQGCWLGVRVEVLSGALVRKESIVGAHAVVEEEIPAWAIAVGRPAKIVRFRKV